MAEGHMKKRKIARNIIFMLLIMAVGSAAAPTASAHSCVGDFSCGDCKEGAHIHHGQTTCVSTGLQRSEACDPATSEIQYYSCIILEIISITAPLPVTTVAQSTP